MKISNQCAVLSAALAMMGDPDYYDVMVAASDGGAKKRFKRPERSDQESVERSLEADRKRARKAAKRLEQYRRSQERNYT